MKPLSNSRSVCLQSILKVCDGESKRLKRFRGRLAEWSDAKYISGAFSCRGPEIFLNFIAEIKVKGAETAIIFSFPVLTTSSVGGSGWMDVAFYADLLFSRHAIFPPKEGLRRRLGWMMGFTVKLDIE